MNPLLPNEGRRVKNYSVVRDVWSALLMVEYATLLVDEGWLKKTLCAIHLRVLMAKRQKGWLALCPGPRGPNLLHFGVTSYTEGHSLPFSQISVLPQVMVASGEGPSGHTRCPRKKILLFSVKPWGRKEKPWQNAAGRRTAGLLPDQLVACPTPEPWWHPCLCE